MECPISKENSKQLTDELWKKLISNGAYALTQKNLYDYLIYLFNKYDRNHFF